MPGASPPNGNEKTNSPSTGRATPAGAVTLAGSEASEVALSLWDVDELAVRLHTSVRHVRRLVAERRIPYVKVGHFVRFQPAEVIRWIDDQRVEPVTDGAPRPGAWVRQRTATVDFNRPLAPRAVTPPAPRTPSRGY